MKFIISFYIICVSPLPPGERSMNPVYLNFPLAYENGKYVENRI
jgi:hypothetical protein